MRSGIQAFIAGFIAPALAVTLFIALLASQSSLHVLSAYPVYFIPVLWGIWNLLYYYIGRHILLLKKIGLWGALLGLGISFAGMYQFRTLEMYQRILSSNVFAYQVLVLDAVLYFFLWESVVRYCDRILID